MAILGTAGGIGVLIATSGGEEEVVQQVATGTPGATATSTSAPSPSATATSPTPTPEPSPQPIPEDWQTYTDAVLGFSLRYPPDLTFNDLTGPSPSGVDLRLIQFGLAGEQRRGFTVSFSETFGLSLEQWSIDRAACRSTSMQSITLSGWPAISCTRETIEGRPGTPAVLSKNDHFIVLISVGGLTDLELSHLKNSFRF